MNDAAPKILFRMPVALRWRDLDAFQHVNNSNFLTYLEEARIRWFESWNGEWVTDTTAPLLAAVQLNYRMPIPYPADVAVELFADGHVVMVWIDRASGRPVPLPEAVRNALA